MAVFLHHFITESQFQDKRKNDYFEPWVSLTEDIDRVDYNKTDKERQLGRPLTFNVLSSGTLYWKAYASAALSNVIEYSKNDGEWISVTPSTGTGTAICQVIPGDIVQFRGQNIAYVDTCFNSNEDCKFDVEGNVMSLFYPTDFADKKVFPQPDRGYSCMDLFNSCYGVVNANKFQLPATALTEGCYMNMLSSCENLISVPDLPATELVYDCYDFMFGYCTSLTGVPKDYLPATNLASACYWAMFDNCESLVQAPDLPATTLVEDCYKEMFNGCTSLSHIKAMFTTTPGTQYTNMWVRGVPQSGTFVKNSAASWDVRGDDGIPNGWTVIEA